MSRREEIEGYAPLLDDLETWKLGTPTTNHFAPRDNDKRSKAKAPITETHHANDHSTN